MLTPGKINFIFKITEELFIHVYDKREDFILDRWTKLKFQGEVIKWIDFFLHKYVTTVDKESVFMGSDRDIEENHKIHDLLFPSKPKALHLKYIFIKILLIYTMI